MGTPGPGSRGVIFLVGAALGVMASLLLAPERRSRSVHSVTDRDASTDASVDADIPGTLVGNGPSVAMTGHAAAVNAAAPADFKERAQSFLNEYARAVDPSTSRAEALRILGRLDELDERWTAHFVELFENAARGDPGGRSRVSMAALDLVLWSGGADASDFLKRHLGEARSDLSPLHAQNLKASVSGINSMYCRHDRIPVDPELQAIATRLTSSSDGLDRRAGAGLLGGVGSSQAPRLMDLARDDPDVSVRTAALRALGRTGNRETREFLESTLRRLEDGSSHEPAFVAGWVRAALADLSRRSGGP